MAHIMVVDDEKDVVTLIRFLLEKDGHQVTEAYNGVEALSKLGVEPPSKEGMTPNLIIMDVMMPVMDGYQLNMRLQTETRAKDIPILVLTAKGQKMRDLFEMAPNVAAYVQKPFDPKMIREMITGILAARGEKKNV